MIIVVNDGGKLSIKMSTVIQNFEAPKERHFYVFRKNGGFEEKQGNDYLELANTLWGNLGHILLMALKDPKNLHDALLRRLSSQKISNFLFVEGSLSVLSQALSEYFEKPANQKNLLKFLRKINERKIFLIDEFVSVRLLDLEVLKHFGKIIYVSQDVAHERYGTGENLIAKTLMYKLEQDAVKQADLVVACSERDCIKYIEMGGRKAVFYPNVYPIGFTAQGKDPQPSICIVLRRHWGSRGEKSLQEILEALSLINGQIHLYLIGTRPKLIPKNVSLEHFDNIPSKTDYLRILSKAWIGINIGIHKGGTNERKYDYALAGLFVFSDTLGARGDLLPMESTFVDRNDLVAKINQLLILGREQIAKMGLENREAILSLAKKQQRELLKAINSTISHS